jgi:hypothetical protein
MKRLLVLLVLLLTACGVAPAPQAAELALAEPITVNVYVHMPTAEPTAILPATATPQATATPVPPTPTPIVWPTDTPAATATPPRVPDLLIDPRFEEMGVVVNQRPAARYKAIAAWCWFNGDKATAPDWAQKYMQMPEAGADHNVFGIVAGNVEPVTFRLWWPGDFTLRDTVGWINVPIFDKCWEKATCAYNWRVDAGDELLRIGLWQGVHTSYAIVYVDTGPK